MLIEISYASTAVPKKHTRPGFFTEVATLLVATSLPVEAERQTHLTLGSLFKSKD